MKWSLPVARLFGITIRAHATFPLLLLAVAFLPWRGDGTGGLAAAGFVLLLFAFVVPHELGHSLVARTFRIRVREILLMPLGGVSRMESHPRRPVEEVLIALAGPAVNVVLAFVFLVVALASGAFSRALAGGGWTVLLDCVAVNLLLAAFNLLPFLPLDGGRILRAVLASVVGLPRATRLAAAVGFAAGAVAVVAGAFVVGSLWLVLLGAFIALGAAVEKRATLIRLALREVPVRSVMTRGPECVPPDLPLSQLAEAATHGFQQDFPVIRNHSPVALLTKADLAEALRRLPPGSSVARAVGSEYLVCASGDRLESVHALMLAVKKPACLVIAHDRVIGLVTLDGIDRFISLANASGSQRAGHDRSA